MRITVTRYECDKCGAVHNTEEQANECEKFGTEIVPKLLEILKPGHFIVFKQALVLIRKVDYFSPDRHCFNSLFVERVDSKDVYNMHYWFDSFVEVIPFEEGLTKYQWKPAFMKLFLKQGGELVSKYKDHLMSLDKQVLVERIIENDT